MVGYKVEVVGSRKQEATSVCVCTGGTGAVWRRRKKGCRSGRERTRDREVAMMDGGEDGGGGGGGGKEAEESIVGRVVGGEGEGRREKRGRRNPLLNGPQVSLSG